MSHRILPEGSASRTQNPVPASRRGVEEDPSSRWSSGRLASSAAVRDLFFYAGSGMGGISNAAHLLAARDQVLVWGSWAGAAPAAPGRIRHRSTTRTRTDADADVSGLL